MTAKKTPHETPLRKPKTGKGMLRVGNPGNKGGGRTSDAFQEMCRALSSSESVRENVERILGNPVDHANLYIGALKWATENGYGKPKESIELTGKNGGPVIVEFRREERKRTAD